jgi:hypothetical protein
MRVVSLRVVLDRKRDGGKSRKDTRTVTAAARALLYSMLVFSWPRFYPVAILIAKVRGNVSDSHFRSHYPAANVTSSMIHWPRLYHPSSPLHLQCLATLTRGFPPRPLASLFPAFISNSLLHCRTLIIMANADVPIGMFMISPAFPISPV